MNTILVENYYNILKDNCMYMHSFVYYLILTMTCHMMQEEGVRGRGVVRPLAEAWKRCPMHVLMLIRSVGFGPFLDSLVGAPKKRNLMLISALA